MIVLKCPFKAKAQHNSTKQPNVLLIYTDDHRFTGVHALGGQDVKTPNIDALANQGLVFTNTYLMGAFTGATCMPSRAQLLSGRNLFDLDGNGHKIPKEHITIGEMFQKSGYQSHIIGKWHQDNKSLARTFNGGSHIMSRGVYLQDQFRMPLWDWKPNGNYKKEDGYILVYNKAGEIVRRTISKDDKKAPISTEIDGPHTSEIYAESASKFINKRDKKTPFFLYLAFHAPHDPRQAPEKYKAMYPEDSIQLPPSYMPQHPFDNGHMTVRDEKLDDFPRTPSIARKHLSDYYAIITHLDAQIGKVISTLKKTRQYENTIIVLAGDSGLGVGNHGLLGKQNLYDEDGIHVPFIISGKVKGFGKKLKAYSYIHDIYPTICDLAGLDIPKTVTGTSLLPIIKGEKTQVRDYTYHAYRQHQRAYRKGDYKLIEFVKAPDTDHHKNKIISGSRTTLLFNIKKDPWETTNLAFLETHQDILKTLRIEMKEVAEKHKDNKDQLNYPFDFWDYYK
ncbi:sulfatase-like hydrolase/transferase [uncultured Algibacter sp.]|uniref:sulfatase-like hydrolase/transferase n=1 Tax=uncultured Algibacter sp. TaxID=298659 RepID=UPI003217EBF1